MTPVFAINTGRISIYVFRNFLIKSVHAPRASVKLFYTLCRVTTCRVCTYAEQSVWMQFSRETRVSRRAPPAQSLVEVPVLPALPALSYVEGSLPKGAFVEGPPRGWNQGINRRCTPINADEIQFSSFKFLVSDIQDLPPIYTDGHGSRA